jgi:hypothetical protein
MTDIFFEKNLLNRQFIDEHLEEIRNKYPLKYLLVFDKKIIESFDSFDEASKFAVKKYGINKPFFIHRVDEVADVYYLSYEFA